jgi:hypothetical protein
MDGLNPFNSNVLSVTEIELTAIMSPAISGLITTEANG